MGDDFWNQLLVELWQIVKPLVIHIGLAATPLNADGSLAILNDGGVDFKAASQMPCLRLRSFLGVLV